MSECSNYSGIAINEVLAAFLKKRMKYFWERVLGGIWRILERGLRKSRSTTDHSFTLTEIMPTCYKYQIHT